MTLRSVIILCLFIDAGAFACYRIGRWTSRHEAAALRQNISVVCAERDRHAASLRALGFDPRSGTYVGDKERSAP